MKAPIEEINAFVDRNKEEMLLFWEQLVNRQAGSKEVDRVNRIMYFLKEHFEQEGIDCRLVDSRGVQMCWWRSSMQMSPVRRFSFQGIATLYFLPAAIQRIPSISKTALPEAPAYWI